MYEPYNALTDQYGGAASIAKFWLSTINTQTPRINPIALYRVASSCGGRSSDCMKVSVRQSRSQFLELEHENTEQGVWLYIDLAIKQ